MGRITNDLFEVTEFSHHCPEEFFIAALKIVISFAILCTCSVPLTILLFLGYQVARRNGAVDYKETAAQDNHHVHQAVKEAGGGLE